MSQNIKSGAKKEENSPKHDPRLGRPLGSAKEAREAQERINANNRNAAKRGWKTRRREMKNLDRMIADAVVLDDR